MDNIPIKKMGADGINPNLDLPEEVKAALQNDIDNAQATAPAAPVQHDFPTEVIELPSEGHFYDPSSPLSNGKLELKYMTAKEEDILTSQNLIKKGVVLDKLLESLIVTPGVTPDDILVGDRNAVFVAARILAYGSKYEAKVVCPKCGEENDVSIELTKLTNKEFDFSGFTKGVNEFEFELPISRKVVRYKLLKGKDEKNIEEELKALSKLNKNGPSHEVTTRLKHVIVSVDGDDKRGIVNAFVDNMPSQDARELRKHIKEHSPDFDMTFDFTCEHCDHEGRIQMPMGINFFWPDAEL
jgi:hypothetical protein